MYNDITYENNIARHDKHTKPQSSSCHLRYAKITLNASDVE